MASKERLPTVRVNFFDGQRVTESDLDTEQIYNGTVTSNIVTDFHASGVVNDCPFEEVILLDTRAPGSNTLSPTGENPSKLDIEGGRYDGKGISLDKGPSDTVRGNRIQLELYDSEARGRDRVKVIVLGRAFDGINSEGPLIAEYIEFEKNGKKITQNFFREIEAVFFNNFSGGLGRTETAASAESKDLISDSSGYMIIKESEPLTVFPASEMSFQVQSPNNDLANFITSSTTLTLEQEFAAALGASSSVSEIYLDFEGLEDITFEEGGDVTVAYGQKFLSKTNNLQKIDLLLSVENNTEGELEDNFDWSGDLVLSIYELSTEIDCPTDAVPNELIDFDPEAAPIVETSFNQDDLEALGVKLTDQLTKVSFNFSGTLLADPNIEPSIEPNKFYAFLLSRRGDNRTGTITLKKGYSVKAGKLANGVDLTTFEEFSKDESRYFEYDPNTKRFVSDSGASLWYIVHSDSVEVTDGTAYADDGVAVTVPKTRSFVGESEISYFANNISLSSVAEGDDNFVVLSHVNEFVDADVHPRTGNFVFSKIQDSAAISLVDTTGLNDLLEDTIPVLLAKVTDKNVRDAQPINGTFDKPGFIYRDYAIIEDPSTALLTSNLVNRVFVPDTECQCNAMYRITEAECVTELAGDLDDDGELTSSDILELLNVVGNTINSESTERAILGGALDIVDFIKSDLDNNDTVDGTDIELLEDAVDGYVNFSVPEQIRFLIIRVENMFEEDNFPTIFTDTALSGVTTSDDDILTFVTTTENQALIIRPGDTVQIGSGVDAGTYKVAGKTIAADNVTVSVVVTTTDDEEVIFEGSSGFNVIVASGTAVNMLADNNELVDIPFSEGSYEISFVNAPFEEQFVDVCDLRRFVESSFLELETKSCECSDEDLCPDDEDCTPKYKSQKYLPGDLYIPDGEILTAPGVPYHGDFEFANITVPLPPGSITDCSIDLYNTFVKSEDGSCKTPAGFPAMLYSDGTYVGCQDSGSDTDITKGRVKFSHAVCSLFVDGIIDGYGVDDGYGEVTDSTNSTESITEEFVDDSFSAFDSWTEDPGNNVSITNISNPSGTNSPAVFDIITSSDSGERYGRLNVPAASQDFIGDFIVDFTASRTVWPESSLTNGVVSAFATLTILNTDGSTATLKLGWRTLAGENTELFYSGVIEDSLMTVVSTFDFSIDAPEAVGDQVRFRLRRIDDVVSAYYITDDSIDDADITSFGQYVRIGSNPELQPGSGTVTNFSYEISQNNAPNAGVSFFTRLSEVVIRSEYSSDDSIVQMIAGRDAGTGEIDRFTLTFPLNLTRRTTVISAAIKLTSQVTDTITDAINVIALDILNADNLGSLFNVPISEEASLRTSFIPGTVSFGDEIEVDVTELIKTFLLSTGHLPGQFKGFVFEPTITSDSMLAVSSLATLEVTYLDTTTGIVFKVGVSLDRDTGLVTLNTKNVLYDDLIEENRTVINFGVYLKKSGFRNSDVAISIDELSRIGIGSCSEEESLPEEESCFFIVGDTAVGTFVEGPFPCQFFLPQPPPSSVIES